VAILAAAFALLVGTVVVVGAPSASSDPVTSTFTPVADSFVEATSPTTNFGKRVRLLVEGDPVRESFIKFDLSAISGSITSVRLRLHVNDASDSPSPQGGTVARVNDTAWTENGITYTNRPTSWGPTAATFGPAVRNTWMEVDVTSAIDAGGLVTLGVRSTHTDGAYYDSREGTQRPELLVTTDTTTSSSSSSTSSSSTTSSSTTSSTTTTTTTTPGGGSTTTVTPVADSFVESTNPGTNFGKRVRLLVEGDPVRESFIKFDLSAISGSITSARLRLHVNDASDSPSPQGGTVARVNDTAWTENGITYTNRPTSWGPTAATFGPAVRNTWMEVDVTSAIDAGGLVTLGVRSTHTDGAYYDSREGTQRPELLVTTGTPPAGLDAVGAACAGSLVASNGGSIGDSALNEPSGVETGVRNPDVLWMHNDSGDTARLFAVGTNGATRRIYTLTGASATDWEDVAIGPGPVAGTPYLYVADIGDNATTRSEIRVHRVPEPAVTTGAPTSLGGVETLRLLYPGGARNAESLMVDPDTGELVIITKTASGGPATVFQAPGGLAAGSLTTLTEVATLTLPSGSTHVVTAADVSADGSQVVVRTYAQVLLFRRTAGTQLWAALSTFPCPGPTPAEPKGEAVTFHPDGRGYLTFNESAGAVLHHSDAP
jgi:hypothetical protein